MDSKNEKPSALFDIDNPVGRTDPKVTNIENHIKKRQQVAPPNRETGSLASEYEKAFSETSGNSVSYLSSAEKNTGYPTAEEPPAAIFSDGNEASDEELSDLEKRILQRIHSELDQNEKLAAQNSAPDTPPRSGDKALLVQLPAPEKKEEPFRVAQFPIQQTAALEVPKETEQVDINMLERWLDKSPRQESGYSPALVITLCLASLFIGIIAGGLGAMAIAGTKDHEKIEVEEAYQAYKLMMASRSSELQTTNLQSEQRETLPRSGSDGGNSGDNNGQHYKGTAAALTFSVPIMEVEEKCDEQPVIKLTPAPAGQTGISIKGRCQKNQTVNIEYAGVTLNKKLDRNGDLNFALDCFAGDKSPITFTFENKQKVVRKPVALDLDKITKVAVIWKGSANLNLHAFEYMAAAGQEGHIWENNPSSFKKAKYKTRQTGKGHGFISSAEKYGSGDQKVEVYTFYNATDQKYGVVQLALDYQLKHNNLHQITCQSQGDITIDYTTVTLSKNKTVKTSKAASILNPCNLLSTNRKMLNTRAVEDLVFGR
ncbi:MAG: hypothetical protein ACRBBN_04750 [Methyloligellaceae bacterium]